jgi:glycosyltransferase involved in cell wall biosynthesis
MKLPRILLSAYQCAPGQGSVSQIGWEWYSRMAKRGPVTLVTHVRNRRFLEAAGAPLKGSEVIYIDTEWFAGPLYSLSKRLFPRSEHSVFLFSSLDFYVFDHEALRQLRPRRKEWDLVHIVTPVSPSAYSRLSQLELPVIRGPLNGGLKTPQNFPEFMKADSAWLYGARDLAKPLQSILSRKTPARTLSANQATDRALSCREREVMLRMPEIAVDPNTYRPSEWPEAPSTLNPLKILFVGRLIPAKALPLLFDAMQGLAVQLTVIGDGPMRDDWEAQAAQRKLKVRFLGACGPSAIETELATAHAFCLPSIRESGGAVLFEAMSAARPVIAVNFGGPAEIVNEDVGRLVDARNPASASSGIANALKEIVAYPDRWREKGIAGRRYILEQHSWDRRIDVGLSVYSQVLEQEAA